MGPCAEQRVRPKGEQYLGGLKISARWLFNGRSARALIWLQPQHFEWRTAMAFWVQAPRGRQASWADCTDSNPSSHQHGSKPKTQAHADASRKNVKQRSGSRALDPARAPQKIELFLGFFMLCQLCSIWRSSPAHAAPLWDCMSGLAAGIGGRASSFPWFAGDPS